MVNIAVSGAKLILYTRDKLKLLGLRPPESMSLKKEFGGGGTAASDAKMITVVGGKLIYDDTKDLTGGYNYTVSLTKKDDDKIYPSVKFTKTDSEGKIKSFEFNSTEAAESYPGAPDLEGFSNSDVWHDSPI